MLVSIIITVYNKEKYINECIKSVIYQDYENIEIIIINDGSQDNSEKIIKSWIEKDSRINYVNQENKGVSYARNKGITLSNGEYVFLLDGDDKLNENAVSSLVKYVKESAADIVIGNFCYKIKNEIIKQPEFENGLYRDSDLQSTHTILEMFIINKRHMATAGNKLYKLKFIKKHNIKFMDNVIAEDRLFNLMCFVNNPSIYVVNEYTYIYNIVNNSRSRSLEQNYYEESINIIYYLYDYLNKKNIFEKYLELYELNVVFDVKKIIDQTFKYSKQKYSFTNKTIKRLRKNFLIYNTVFNLIEQKKYKKWNGNNDLNKIILLNFLFVKAPFLIIFYKLFGNLLWKIKK